MHEAGQAKKYGHFKGSSQFTNTVADLHLSPPDTILGLLFLRGVFGAKIMEIKVTEINVYKITATWMNARFWNSCYM